jgi:hypothetical protein
LKEKIMSQIASIPVLSSAATCLHARSGAFVLAPAQALALSPKQSSTIRITCGSAWVTLGDGRDYFLKAEQTLRVPTGSRVVMESMGKEEALKFDWQPEFKRKGERSALRDSLHEGAAQTGLAQSALELSPLSHALLDLRTAAALAARGLAGLATALAAGLARGGDTGFAALARSAHSSASRAQGRMASCESMASSGAV